MNSNQMVVALPCCDNNTELTLLRNGLMSRFEMEGYQKIVDGNQKYEPQAQSAEEIFVYQLNRVSAGCASPAGSGPYCLEAEVVANHDIAILIRFRAHYANVGIATIYVSERLKSMGFSDTDVGLVELCLAEIANNSIEHAYQGEGEDMVHIEVKGVFPKVEIFVSDYGTSMPDSIFSKEIDFDEIEEGSDAFFSTSGRGLQIVKDVMNKVEYHTQDGKNTFVMQKISENG